MAKPGHTDFPNGGFSTTCWTAVLAAKGNDRGTPSESAQRHDALGFLIQRYWKPIYYYVRRNGFKSDEARDVVQGFFANFLEKDYLKAVKPEKGRFRSFLLVAVKHFLLNERDKSRAQKRGGGVKMLSLDFNEAEDRYTVEPASSETPESLFMRRWARELADSAMQMLEQDYRREGKREFFEAIKPHLGGGDDYATLAQKLGVTVSSLKVSVHRARRKYRELLRQVVRSTVENDSDVDDELSELLRSL